MTWTLDRTPGSGILSVSETLKTVLETIVTSLVFPSQELANSVMKPSISYLAALASINLGLSGMTALVNAACSDYTTFSQVFHMLYAYA